MPCRHQYTSQRDILAERITHACEAATCLQDLTAQQKTLSVGLNSADLARTMSWDTKAINERRQESWMQQALSEAVDLLPRCQATCRKISAVHVSEQRARQSGRWSYISVEGKDPGGGGSYISKSDVQS